MDYGDEKRSFPASTLSAFRLRRDAKFAQVSRGVLVATLPSPHPVPLAGVPDVARHHCPFLSLRSDCLYQLDGILILCTQLVDFLKIGQWEIPGVHITAHLLNTCSLDACF